MTDPRLPLDLTAKAYVAPNGELAWRRRDLPEALRALVDAGHAVLGGEVWMVEDPCRNWDGLIPRGDGSSPGVWGWDTAGRRSTETWHVYTERTLRESLEAVGKMNVEDEADPAIVPMLWFNVTTVGVDE